MEIHLSGRTSESAPPDLILNVTVAEGYVTIRGDDINNRQFWFEARIPQQTMIPLVGCHVGSLRHRNDPVTGLPDQDSQIELDGPDVLDDPEWDIENNRPFDYPDADFS